MVDEEVEVIVAADGRVEAVMADAAAVADIPTLDVPGVSREVEDINGPNDGGSCLMGFTTVVCRRRGRTCKKSN